MKKLILVLLAVFLPFALSAQGLSGAYKRAKDVVFVGDEPDACPVYASTPYGEVVREAWEIELGLSLIAFPSNGPPQFMSDGISMTLIHNISASFGAYASYNSMTLNKYEYENSEYDDEWKVQAAHGGFHLYVSPIIRVYAGAGKVWMKDKQGNEPDLDMSVEKGISIDVPLGGYKAVIGYKAVEARLTDAEDSDVSEAYAEGSYSVVYVTLSIPLGGAKRQ